MSLKRKKLEKKVILRHEEGNPKWKSIYAQELFNDSIEGCEEANEELLTKTIKKIRKIHQGLHTKATQTEPFSSKEDAKVWLSNMANEFHSVFGCLETPSFKTVTVTLDFGSSESDNDDGNEAEEPVTKKKLKDPSKTLDDFCPGHSYLKTLPKLSTQIKTPV